MTATITAAEYTPTSAEKTTGSSSSASGGGSSSSAKKTKLYKATVPNVGPGYPSQDLKGYKTEEEALKAAQAWVNQACRTLGGSSSSMIGQWAAELKKKIVITAYEKGGLAFDTGLAWLDGTKQKPERILNPYQTELFEDMIRSLHEIRRFKAPVSSVIP